jgi:hypothetical protein
MYKVTNYIRCGFAGMGDGLTGESLEAREHSRKILVSPCLRVPTAAQIQLSLSSPLWAFA